MNHSGYTLYVEVPYLERVFLDEVAARFHFVPHQDRKDLIHAGEVFELDLHKRAGLRVHRGFPQLSWVHFAQAFVALEANTLLAGLQNSPNQLSRPRILSLRIRDLHLVRWTAQPDGRRSQFL